jgi:hypothetical protein
MMAGAAVLVGFALRLYSFLVTPVINPDGTFYIQQAKAIHYGLWDQVLSCYPYLSSYPLLIVFSFGICGDWVLAAKVVSLVVGSATLIPLYLLLRKFFDRTISGLALMMFAVSPPFVELSREVIRDPIFWFFTVLGLYLVVRHLEKPTLASILFASVSFLLGAWARTEGLLFILVTPLYILFSNAEHRWRRAAAFVIPPSLVTFAVGIVLWSFQFHLGDLFAAKKVGALLSGPITSYQGLREALEGMKDGSASGVSPYFWDKVRNLVWLVALGSLVVEIIRAFFIPFFAVFLLGLVGIGKRVREDSRLRFLAVISLCALPILYLQVIHSWAMFARFIAVFLFPAYVVVGFGVQRVVGFLTERLELKSSVACGAVAVSILLVAVPKDLRSHDRTEKVVFKEIGAAIADQKGNRGSVSVAGRCKEVRLVHFYAHVNDTAAPCFSEKLLAQYRRAGILNFRNASVDYYVWDEKTGTAEQLEKLRKGEAGTVREVNEWRSRKFGRLILFEVGP